MTRHFPAAAAAVIEAVLEDARRNGVTDPAVTARWAVNALETAGWTLTPGRTPYATHNAA